MICSRKASRFFFTVSTLTDITSVAPAAMAPPSLGSAALDISGVAVVQTEMELFLAIRHTPRQG